MEDKTLTYFVSMLEAVLFVVSWLMVYEFMIPHIQWSFFAVFVIFVLTIASKSDGLKITLRDGNKDED